MTERNTGPKRNFAAARSLAAGLAVCLAAFVLLFVAFGASVGEASQQFLNLEASELSMFGDMPGEGPLESPGETDEDLEDEKDKDLVFLAEWTDSPARSNAPAHGPSRLLRPNTAHLRGLEKPPRS